MSSYSSGVSMKRLVEAASVGRYGGIYSITREPRRLPLARVAFKGIVTRTTAARLRAGGRG